MFAADAAVAATVADAAVAAIVPDVAAIVRGVYCMSVDVFVVV